MISVRIDEGCAPESNLAWDTVWDPATGLGDWAVARPRDRPNLGGLRARAALATAVALALFTDKRCPANHPLAKFADGDLRGWWGDSVDLRDDLGEAPLGSLLWLLERAPLTDPMAKWAKAMAEEALAPLVAQGAVARVDVAAEADRANARLNLGVSLYAADGARVYDRKFDLLWRQIDAPSPDGQFENFDGAFDVGFS